MNPQRMEPTDQPSVGGTQGSNVTPSMRSHVPALGPPGPTFGRMRSHVPARGVESANSTLSIRSHVPAAGVGVIWAIGQVRGSPDGIHSFPSQETTLKRRPRAGERASLPNVPVAGLKPIR